MKDWTLKMWLAFFLVGFCSLYDFLTTAIGFGAIFEAKSILQIIFVGIASFAFLIAVGSTLPLWRITSDRSINPLLAFGIWVFWLITLAFNLFTTFIGVVAVASSKEYSVVLTELFSSLKDFHIVAVYAFILVTIFITCCTAATGYLITERDVD